MNAYGTFIIGTWIVVTSLAGCARSAAEPANSKQNNHFLLTAEPEGALDVMDVREQAQDGQSVVVLGRIDGGLKPWIDGRAAFSIMDERVAPSCDATECEAGCPQCVQQVAEATAMVKFLDDQGKVLAVDARDLLGLKEQQTVVIRGIAKRDESGNVAIAADGVFVRR